MAKNQSNADKASSHLYNATCHSAQAMAHVSNLREHGGRPYVISTLSAIQLAINDLEAAKKCIEGLGGEQLEYVGKVKVFGEDDQQVTFRTDGPIHARKITLDAPRVRTEIFDIVPKERERR